MSKFWYRFILFSFLLIPVVVVLIFKQPRAAYEINDVPESSDEFSAYQFHQDISGDSVLFFMELDQDVRIKDYFEFIDGKVAQYDSIVSYQMTEHLLVRANPWIIDSLVATDYYTKIEKGEFVFDQKELIILHTGDTLLIPDSTWANQFIDRQKNTLIDINIPEYLLRIIENGKERYRFTVRVGQDKERFLKTANRVEKLATRTGTGHVAKIKRDPTYLNPVDGHQYQSTARDDGRRTQLPQIPFLHPEINGHRWGQLIHPTTNANTLGKAYSNGCIGTGEGDAWRIYYHAPVGTAVQIRYDLEVVNELGDTLILKDIYKKSRKPNL